MRRVSSGLSRLSSYINKWLVLGLTWPGLPSPRIFLTARPFVTMGSSSPDADHVFFSTTKGYKSHVLGSPAEPRRYVRGEGWGGGWGSIIQSLHCGPRLILIFEFEGPLTFYRATFQSLFQSFTVRSKVLTRDYS